VRRTIAILHYAGPPSIGGVEITIAAHARLLAADGYQVRIVAGNGGDVNADARAYVRPEFGSRGALIERVNAELARGVVGADFAALTDRIAAELGPILDGVDTVVVHNVLSLHKNLAFTAALYRLHQAGRLPRMLAWCHDFAWGDPLYLPEMHAGEPWSLLKTPWPGVRYVVVSDDRRPMLAGLFGLPLDAVEVITPGLDLTHRLHDPASLSLLDRLGLLEADPLLLLPARITRRKNIGQAIRIAAALRDIGMRPRLLVTGPLGPHNPANRRLLDELLAMCARHDANDLVSFLCLDYRDVAGQEIPVSDAMIADFYRLADALLFTSEAEGFGIPMIEALFDRLPIVCSDIAVFRSIAGDAATYFPLDVEAQADQRPVAAQIAARLQAGPLYAKRREVRLEKTWEAIYRRQIKPLIEE
jgi:glycosyltransferase involved in cell wall biosynthesis